MKPYLDNINNVIQILRSSLSRISDQGSSPLIGYVIVYRAHQFRSQCQLDPLQLKMCVCVSLNRFFGHIQIELHNEVLFSDKKNI